VLFCSAKLCLSLGRMKAHPLRPLTPEEIRLAADVVRGSAPFPEEPLFERIQLHEPPKEAWLANKVSSREAEVCIFRSSSLGVWKLIISLPDRQVVDKKFYPEARPMIQLEQFIAIEEAVRSCPAFVNACKKRGMEDLSLVCIDPWSAGSFGSPEEQNRHLALAFCWLRTRLHDNLYAHPIEGLYAMVDVLKNEVVCVHDLGITPIPQTECNYEPLLRDDLRPRMKPLRILQEEGPSFTLHEHSLSWDRWTAVIGFNAREGITLHDICYGGRPVARRMSLVEMVVPYGTPAAPHYRKNVFDVGEYGIGKLANSLRRNCDCVGHVVYLDAHLSSMRGDVLTIPNAICIHEEDAGLLWKHWDFRTDRAETRRGRRLVISSISTVCNYEYASYWYFRQDGVIEFEMRATGVINTVACLPGQPSRYGAEVMPGVEGQIHQHYFCVRIDISIDGDRNSIVECNTQAEDEALNPFGNAYFVVETPLRRELEACRRANPTTHRYWKVLNAEKLNKVHRPVAYKLEPTHALTPFLKPDAPSGRRSQFIQNHLWVTAYHPDERFPAGEFVNLSDGQDSIAEFVQKNRDLEQADLVLWHVFGLHHLPRTEDFPVQPAMSTGFMLQPCGFFDENPAINLPPPVDTRSNDCNACE
jgi:primary-amine oxidase